MNHTARSPFVSIRCPYTHEALFVREVQLTQGTNDKFATWGWQYDGKKFENLDEVLEFRAKRYGG